MVPPDTSASLRMGMALLQVPAGHLALLQLLLLLRLAARASAACPPRLAGLWGPDPCVFASHMVLEAEARFVPVSAACT